MRDPNAPTHVYTNKNGKVVRRYRFQNPLFGQRHDETRPTRDDGEANGFSRGEHEGLRRSQFKTLCVDIATDLLARALRLTRSRDEPESERRRSRRCRTRHQVSTDPRSSTMHLSPSLGGARKPGIVRGRLRPSTIPPGGKHDQDGEPGHRHRRARHRGTAMYCPRRSRKFTKLVDGPEKSITVILTSKRTRAGRRQASTDSRRALRRSTTC